MKQGYQYTSKGLTRLLGSHRVDRCKDANCAVCKAAKAYASHLYRQEDKRNQERLQQQHWDMYRLSLSGWSVRKIAFEMDLDDAEVEAYLKQIKQHPSRRPQQPHPRKHRAVTPGMPVTKRKQAELAKLINQGLSRQAIANRQHRSIQAVSQFINYHSELPAVRERNVTIHIVSYGKGQHRYFDSKGHEYQLEKVNGGNM